MKVNNCILDVTVLQETIVPNVLDMCTGGNHEQLKSYGSVDLLVQLSTYGCQA